MDYEKAWSELRAAFLKRKINFPCDDRQPVAEILKLMDKLEDEQKNGIETKEVK